MNDRSNWAWADAAGLLGLLLLASPGAAQQVNCVNPMTQVEINFCAETDYRAADAELNRAYNVAREMMRQVDADLPAPQRGAEVALRDAQRAWITFRDQACLAEAHVWTGGSGYPMVFYGCQSRVTRQRAADLWELGRGY